MRRCQNAADLSGRFAIRMPQKVRMFQELLGMERLRNAKPVLLAIAAVCGLLVTVGGGAETPSAARQATIAASPAHAPQSGASSGLRRVIRSGKYLPIGSATAPKRDRPLKQYLLPTELTPLISNFLKLKSSQFSCKKDQATRAVTGVTFSQTGRFIWRLCHSEAPPGPTNNRNAISKARCNRLFPASRRQAGS